MQKMNAWLLGLGLALLCTIRAEGDGSSDTVDEKGPKEIYALGVATNHPKLLQHMDKMDITKVTYEKLEDGSLTATIIPQKNHWKPFTITFKRTEDGQYVQECGWGQKVLDIIYEAEDDAFYIVDVTIKKKEQEPKVTLVLLAEDSWITPEMEAEFMKRVEEYGLSKKHSKLYDVHV